MLFPIQNLLLNTDSSELETLMGLAKTKLQTNICIFMFFFFFSIYETKNAAANF